MRGKWRNNGVNHTLTKTNKFMKNFVFCLVLCVSAFANTQISELEKECEAGNSDKCFELATNLENSCDKTKNFEVGAKAIKYYEKICNSNEAHIYTACIRLASIYNRGNCAQENSPKTLKYLKLSCEKENLTNVCAVYQRILDTILKSKGY
ncbi:hypothetical protein [Campylobacter sp. JMF_08 NE1]|uniref:hypothetical protein n=1 Tax=Campylobacter sp. JMF_08 NE1 TaxID=2983821 RepID=UPI0022E9A63C|nr:hypothetical protein [Campylobacter sp. JMF_08 NE1]MDA3047946.1 hypothetical protein [Campylobacter sp. JMF_08 NE1]